MCHIPDISSNDLQYMHVKIMTSGQSDDKNSDRIAFSLLIFPVQC
nr:MAG TPA: hypothetical protein [Bacteriophage sp.]